MVVVLFANKPENGKVVMSIRNFMMIGVVVGLAACQPAVPDSGASVQDSGRGVGFDDPSTLSARQARDAQLEASIIPTPAPVSSGTPLSALSTPVTDPTQRTARALSDPQSLDAELAAGGVDSTAPLGQSNPDISDENSFDAVAGRETIASDAARIEANRQLYQVVEPTELPERSGSEQPNVVQFALETSHPKGTKIYRRSNLPSLSSLERSCARYASSDEAQIDFLARGGPERDRRGLDPDGDGYACDWDPAPFRPSSGG